MIAEMYKRREKMAWIFLAGTVVIILLWIFLQPPETSGEWFELLAFLFPIGFVVAVILLSRFQYNKVKDIVIPNFEETIHSTNHIVIKKDAALLSRLLLFQQDGRFIGIVKPVQITWWKYILLAMNKTFMGILPLKFALVTHDNQTILSFDKKGWFKQVEIMIYNEENENIGRYIQHEWKSLFQIKGELVSEEDQPILDIKASGFSGDFKWKDEEGKQWAYFYNGKFPHEYTHLFRDSHNDIVELSTSISEKDKLRLLAVISYLFIARLEK